MELILVAATIGVLGVVGIALVPVMRYAPYAYSNARVKTRAGKLFTEEEIRRLAAQEHIDIVYELESRGYGLLEYEASGFREESVQNALRSKHFGELRELTRYVPTDARRFFLTLASLSDYEFMITVVRSKTNPYYEDLLLTDLILDSTVFSSTDVERSWKMPLEDFIARVRGSPYRSLIESHAHEIREGRIGAFEKACYEHYYARLTAASSHPVLRSFAKREVDSFIIKTALTFEGLEPISGGTFTTDAKSQLTRVDSVDDLKRIITGTYLEKHLAAETTSAGIVRRLLRVQRDLVHQAAAREPLGVARVLSYYCAHRIELRNLRIILKLVHARFDPESIAEAIV